MAWETTPRLNPWELVDVFLSEGSTVMIVAEGQASAPMPITSQLVPTELQ